MNVRSIVTVDGSDASHVGAARALFAEYHSWLGEVVCSRTLDAETAALPGIYAPPAGRLLLALSADAGEPLGVVGVRPFSDTGEQAEIKRLYVREAARGLGLGRELAERALEAARVIGYSEALLTTLPDSMGVALSMYLRLGFEECEPFCDHSSVAGGTRMSFMRRTLITP